MEILLIIRWTPRNSWRILWWDTHVFPFKKLREKTVVVLCFVIVTSSFLDDLFGLFTHILQGCFTGTGAIVAPVPVKQPWRIWVKWDASHHNKTLKAQPVCIVLVMCSAIHTRRWILIYYVRLADIPVIHTRPYMVWLQTLATHILKGYLKKWMRTIFIRIREHFWVSVVFRMKIPSKPYPHCWLCRESNVYVAHRTSNILVITLNK